MGLVQLRQLQLIKGVNMVDDNVNDDLINEADEVEVEEMVGDGAEKLEQELEDLKMASLKAEAEYELEKAEVIGLEEQLDEIEQNGNAT